MSIFDFFTREAGQERRRALEGLLTQFIPPEMRPQLGLLAEANPVVSMERAGQDAQQLFAPDQTIMDRIASLGRMSSNIAGTVAPAVVAGRAGVPVANAVQDVLTGYSPMVQPFMVDDFGGVKLYHGSPHDFDRFSMSKIGTGEGAQAYGHGLYFAENEGVARGYRDALSARAAPNDARGNAFDLVQRMGGDEAATAEILRDAIANTPSPNTQQFLTDTLRHIEEKTYSDFERPLGSMYEVNVNANPEDFINFDAPFEQQPPNVQKHFSYLARGESKPTGEDLARRMESNIYIQEAAQAGIPGIRYLDEGSRGQSLAPYYNVVRESDGAVVQQKIDRGVKPEVSEGFRVEGPIDTRTRNYVVFDENLIEIVRKYGIAGAAAMLGMSQADVAQAMQQQPQPQGLLTGPQ